MSPRISRRRLLLASGAAPFALASLSAGQTQTAAEAVWVWSGNIGTASATVKARIRGAPRDLHLQVDTDRQLQSVLRVAADNSALGDAGVVTFQLEGLSPNTHYFYAVVDGDQRLASGELTTFAVGPMSFQFALASCAGGGVMSNVSNDRIFTDIEQRRPLFMLHMGDFHYRNINRNDIAEFRRAYDAVLTQERQAALYRRTPIVYVWDDHDFGPDESDRTSPARDAARRAYAEHVPHYPLARQGNATTTIQQEFTVGRVRFIVSDLRSERDPVSAPDGPTKSMLGAPQREWLATAFERAAHDGVPLVFWVSSVPWITRIGDPTHGWQPYAWERQWLADRLLALGLSKRLVMLSGDAHMVAIDDGTNSQYAATATAADRGFPVFQAAPLDRRRSNKGGPYSHGVSVANHQFGWVTIDDDGDELRATLSGYGKEGRPLRGMQLKLACREGECRVITP